MKKKLLAVALLVLGLLFSIPAYATNSYMACIGDSYTETGSHGQFQAYVAAHYPNMTMHDAGFSADSCVQQDARFSTDVMTWLAAQGAGNKYVHIECGINDVYRDVAVADTEAAITDMITTAEASGYSVYISTIPYLAINGSVARIQKTNTLNQFIINLATADGNSRVLIGLQNLVNGNSLSMLASCDAGDTIHPSAACENLWGQLIVNRLNMPVSRPVPVLSSCGNSPTLTSGSNDFKGSFTIGATGTGCVLTFGTADIKGCTVVATTSANLTSATISSSAITVVGLPDTFYYECFK